MTVRTCLTWLLIVGPLAATFAMAAIPRFRGWAIWPFGVFAVTMGAVLGGALGAFLGMPSNPDDVRCGLPLMGLLGAIGVVFAFALAIGLAFVAIAKTRGLGIAIISKVLPLFALAVIVAVIVAANWGH